MPALILCLLFFFPSEPERTVALVFADRTEIVSVKSAEREFARLEKLKTRDDEEEKRYAALLWALSIRHKNEYLACANRDPDRHQPLCETIRGRRLPLQNRNPK